MPSEHDARQRAVICQDCWFWKEMSCALANPTSGVCANRRPVRGRAVSAPQVAALQPAAVVPFATDAPESTFSVTALRANVATPPRVSADLDSNRQLAFAQPATATSSVPSFREIRSGRAAAAAKMPEPEVRIPIADLDGQLALGSDAPSLTGAGGLDQLVERVRRRTAARLSRAASVL